MHPASVPVVSVSAQATHTFPAVSPEHTWPPVHRPTSPAVTALLSHVFEMQLSTVQELASAHCPSAVHATH